VHPDVQELQVKLKEILYDCATEVKATKAALYLRDAGSDRFDLVTEYGFKGKARPVADEKNPVVDKCEKTRVAFFVNGLMAEPKFSELMFESQSDRLLAVPIYIRGQLVGLVDMRDKGGKVPFDTSDLPKAQSVAERIAQLFAAKNIWGQKFITLSDHAAKVPLSDMAPLPPRVTTTNTPLPPRATTGNMPKPVTPVPNTLPVPPPPVAIPVAAPPPPPPPVQQAVSYLPKVASLILEARTAADRVLNTAIPDTLGEAELNVVREILRAVLQIPGAIVAVFTATGTRGGTQDMVSRAALGDDAIAMMQTKFSSWLSKRGETAANLRNRVQTPFGAGGSPIREVDIKKVFTAPISAGNLTGLYLTVGFASDPERNVHELLAAFHQLLQLAIEESLSRREAMSTRLRVAEKIVEPDFSRYPELRRHSNSTVARVDGFTRFLGLAAGEIETARIVALVHDAGMRLLEYDRLYRKRDLSPDDLNILREHPTVGAAMVDPLLGPEIARAVLCHHERWDGRGYPNFLSSEDIPLVSRIVQICDVYEAMTSVDNYQTPQTHEQAMSTITRGAGTQFDPELVRKFEEYMRTAPRP
jgi:HD domain-containing protein/GAF domain-containing protein